MDSVALTTAVPDSVLPYPQELGNRIKYGFWKFATPIVLWVRARLLKMNILGSWVRYQGRQPALLGTIAEGKTLEQFLHYVEKQDFKNHFFAWKDDNELISLRRLESFERQYHLRIFKDGEVRGHYEYTPESHPFWHAKDVKMEERKEDFLRFLGDWIAPAK